MINSAAIVALTALALWIPGSVSWGLVLAGRQLLVLARAPAPAWLRAAPAYGIGTLAAYWCLERAASLLP